MKMYISPHGRLAAIPSGIINCLTLPTEIDGVFPTEVESSAFYKMHIDKLIIPGQYSRIYSRAFRRCYIKELVILPGPAKLAFDYQSFSYNDIEKVVFPDRVWYIGKSAFALNTNLKEIETSGAEIIFTKAFEGCMNVSKLSISSEKCLIKSCAFSKEIENMDISFDSFVEIEDGAFEGVPIERTESTTT